METHDSRLYYDVTDILEFARSNSTLSGIQRVSTEILSLIAEKYGCKRIRLIAFHPILKRVISCGPEYFIPPFEFDQQHFCRAFALLPNTGASTHLDEYLKKKYGGSAKKEIHKARLLIVNKLTKGRTLRKRNVALTVESNRSYCSSRIPFEQPEFRDGDVVFLPGATWNLVNYIERLAAEKRKSKIRICQFIHDMIPLLAPEHVVDGVPEQFSSWLSAVSLYVDRFIANSQATEKDLKCWMLANDVRTPTSVVRLAHQFCGFGRSPIQFDNSNPASRVGARVLNAARVPYALCVGTIESRKNVWTLVNVWKSIQEKLGLDTPRLIFAGKHGWLKDDFDDFLSGTGSLYGYIKIIERPTDSELVHLYRNCLFSVYPSFKEGWGLPIGEAMWFGRPVICSSVSSMPEVGSYLAEYVEPSSPTSIEAAALKLIKNHAYRESRASEIAAARLRTWADVADDIWIDLVAPPLRSVKSSSFVPQLGVPNREIA